MSKFLRLETPLSSFCPRMQLSVVADFSAVGIAPHDFVQVVLYSYHCSNFPLGFSTNSKVPLPIGSLCCCLSPIAGMYVWCFAALAFLRVREGERAVALCSFVLILALRCAHRDLLLQSAPKIIVLHPIGSFLSMLIFPTRNMQFQVCVFEVFVCTSVCFCVHLCAIFPLAQEVPVSWNHMCKLSWCSHVDTLFLDVLSQCNNHWVVYPSLESRVIVNYRMTICKSENGCWFSGLCGGVTPSTSTKLLNLHSQKVTFLVKL